MEVSEAIRHRRAVRDYLPDPVPRPVLEQIIAAAGWAPSAMNAQPWHFTVVTDQALLQRVSADAKRFNLEATGATPAGGHFRDLMGDPDFNIFYNAPVLLVISAPGGNKWGIEDCALAAANAMLTALDLGLGSCWIGFAESWLNSAQGLALLGLPPGHRVVAPVILGYAKTCAPAVARKPAKVNWVGEDLKPQTFAFTAPSGREIWNCWEPFLPFPALRAP